jgi:hypothetical protein
MLELFSTHMMFMAGLQTFYRENPEAAELYERAAGSAELDRIVADVARFRSEAGVDMGKVVRAVERFVVEPEAIELARGRGRWFEVFRKDVRAEVSLRLGRSLVEGG